MIETEDEFHLVKAIVLAGPDILEKVVASPRISEKLNFTSMTHHQAFDFALREDQHKNGINHVPPNSLPHLCQRNMSMMTFSEKESFGKR